MERAGASAGGGKGRRGRGRCGRGEASRGWCGRRTARSFARQCSPGGARWRSRPTPSSRAGCTLRRARARPKRPCKIHAKVRAVVQGAAGAVRGSGTCGP
eukprot:1930633-Pleurochrysis_carterae.AAC.1